MLSQATALFKVGGIEPLYSGAIIIQESASDIASFSSAIPGTVSNSFERATENIGISNSTRSMMSASCPISRAESANFSANARLLSEVAVIINILAMYLPSGLGSQMCAYNKGRD